MYELPVSSRPFNTLACGHPLLTVFDILVVHLFSDKIIQEWFTCQLLRVDKEECVISRYAGQSTGLPCFRRRCENTSVVLTLWYRAADFWYSRLQKSHIVSLAYANKIAAIPVSVKPYSATLAEDQFKLVVEYFDLAEAFWTTYRKAVAIYNTKDYYTTDGVNLDDMRGTLLKTLNDLSGGQSSSALRPATPLILHRSSNWRAVLMSSSLLVEALGILLVTRAIPVLSQHSVERLGLADLGSSSTLTCLVYRHPFNDGCYP